MTTEEKISRLQILFKQREEVNREIEAILGPAAGKVKSYLPEKPARKISKNKTVITDRIKSEIVEMRAKGFSVRVVAQQLGIGEATVVRYSKPVKSLKEQDKKYYCRDCQKTFVSQDRLIDVVCPFCDSAHIDYATRAKK